MFEIIILFHNSPFQNVLVQIFHSFLRHTHNKGLNITGLPSYFDGKTAYELFEILGLTQMNSIEFFDTADTAYFKV